MAEEIKAMEQDAMNKPETAPEQKPEVKKSFTVEDARKKLEAEKNKTNDKDFAEPIIGHLLKRIEEDSGLVEDIMQSHKTWEKCFNYIYSQARKKKTGNTAAVRDEVVYEWAEDYYRKDDKAEELKKAKADEERKKKAEAAAKNKKPEKKANPPKNPLIELDKKLSGEKTSTKKEPEKQEEKKPEKKPKKTNEIEGQMDLFSMLGI